MFYIEKLIIQGHDFKNVIIKPGDFIYLEENGKAYTLSFDVTAPWQPGYLGNTSYEAAKALAHDFKNAKEAIRKKSTLPASMIADIPTSIIEPPLSYKFLAYKSQPQKMAEFMNTLSPNQKERFEKLIIFNIADAMLGHQYFLYKHDARQLTQWQNRLSQADKAHLEHIEGLWSQYQANKDDEVKLKVFKKSLSPLDAMLLDHLIDAENVLKNIERPEFVKTPYEERPVLERYGAYVAQTWRDVTRWIRGVSEEKKATAKSRQQHFEKQQRNIALILLWREYLLRKENGLSIDDWKELTDEQKTSLNLTITLWNEYQDNKNDTQALNTWKTLLTDAQKDILALLIKITPNSMQV